jgi:hypothetical protein
MPAVLRSLCTGFEFFRFTKDPNHPAADNANLEADGIYGKET